MIKYEEFFGSYKETIKNLWFYTNLIKKNGRRNRKQKNYFP